MQKKDKYLTTRIIGGRWKGKKILLPSADTTRSSKARLRESVFNVLQFDIVGKEFIEMFGGSGSVGLEALSRGAKQAWFIEKDGDACRILKHNCNSLDPARCRILCGDAFDKLPHVIDALGQNGDAYLYVDPPFSIREGHEAIYDRLPQLLAAVPPERIDTIIVEHMTAVDLPENFGPYRLAKKKRFGKSSVSYYTFPKN